MKSQSHTRSPARALKHTLSHIHSHSLSPLRVLEHTHKERDGGPVPSVNGPTHGMPGSKERR